MSYFKNLKTSDRIAVTFSFVNLFFLIILLISINIIYFFIWYEDQKAESLYDVNINYNSYTSGMDDDNKSAFQEYILQKDTIIFPDDGSDLICSDGVLKKVDLDPEQFQNKYFHLLDNKVYFIFSNDYQWIGEVKVLFDTTPYIKSQIIIIKISLFIIFASILLSLLLWKVFARYALRDLRDISEKAKNINIDQKFEKIEITWNKDDEINILAEAINTSMDKIQNQTSSLKQFITDVSHEFKTPLMIINSKIDLYNKKLEKWWLKEGEVQTTLSYIKDNTKKLNDLLEALFVLSRFQEDIVCFVKNKTNISNYLFSTIDDLSDNSDKKNIEILYDIQPDVFTDLEASTFDMMVANLFTNAVKFSPEWWKIKVWLDEKSFWIEDYGIGMDEDTLSKIWGKFYKWDDKIEWFWVGLFLVKRIVDLYGWEVSATSQKQKGTKVTISFR